MLSRLFRLFFNAFLLFKYKFLNFYILNLRKLNTKELLIENIPLCQQRTFITGKGKVIIGSKNKFGYKIGGFYRGGSIEIQARYKDSLIKIGNDLATNNNIFICSAGNIEIGNNVLIGQNVTIMDFEAHGIELHYRNKIGLIGNVVIADNVWIGNNVTILKNSEIGENTIVATGAVVSGKFPSNVILGGVPAKIIKTINGKK